MDSLFNFCDIDCFLRGCEARFKCPKPNADRLSFPEAAYLDRIVSSLSKETWCSDEDCEAVLGREIGDSFGDD